MSISAHSFKLSYVGAKDYQPPFKGENMDLKPYTPLASGFDTIVLAIDVKWSDESFFDYLGMQKEIAVEMDNETAVAISDDIILTKMDGSVLESRLSQALNKNSN